MPALSGVAYPICWLCFITTIIMISLPQWQSNKTSGEVVEQLTKTQGLWVKCTYHPTGNWQCDNVAYRGNLPAAVIGARIFCILGALFQFINLFIIPLGMDCTKTPEAATKRIIVFTTGVLAIAAGVVIGIAVSWYAALIQGDVQAWAGRNMYDGVDTSYQQYKYGVCLYLGWSIMCGCILQGAALCITYANFEESGMQQDQAYNYAEGNNYNMEYQPTTNNFDYKNNDQDFV